MGGNTLVMYVDFLGIGQCTVSTSVDTLADVATIVAYFGAKRLWLYSNNVEWNWSAP